MLRREDIRRICADEVLRARVRHKIQASQRSKKLGLWTFLNSSFGIFLMSSIGLSGLTFVFSSWYQGRERAKETKENTSRLDAEITYRLRFLDVLRKPQFSYTEVYSARSALTGDHADDPTVGRIDEFTPIFSEFRGRTLASLIWELSALPGDDSSTLKSLLPDVRELPDICTVQLMHMLKKEGDDDSVWEFKPPQLEKYTRIMSDLRAVKRWREYR
jgi:hypothetical protein